MKLGIKTAESFNSLSIWSIKRKPHKQGFYSWFALQQKDMIINRERYHMFLDPKESEDIFDQFNDLMETAKAAEKLGIVTDDQEKEEHVKEMTPKQQGTLEGQQVFFYNLYEKRMEKVDLEEGELDGSDTPSEKEIDILTGQVIKHEPVVQGNIDSKQKEKDFMQKLNGDEDFASNNYYGANETMVDHKKKKMQSLRKETKK